MTYTEILLRSILAVTILLLIPRILGKQTVTNMTFHDFVTTITLGSIAANLTFNISLKFTYELTALVLITSLSFLLSVAALKSRKMRSWISGSPTVLIEGGKVLEDNMRKIRYTMDSLDQSLREEGVFNLEEVEYAVLENNGKVSILKKEGYQLATKQDIGLVGRAQSFPIELIMDGEIVDDNLERHGLTRNWLEHELSQRGKTLSDVFYAVRGTQQQLVFDYYKDDIYNPMDKE
ncbi:hypothetical protein CGZ75_10215 [Paenibacillus herberti]|uniref:DUF421 domain-containing protein n=2 Tax=Paenibacillus herberti TaxID=1619309 RepID=A0A229P410_9BACL|nr:hypothetical protein CGZ75_10215 [Paenibacillus herberti]